MKVNQKYLPHSFQYDKIHCLFTFFNLILEMLLLALKSNLHFVNIHFSICFLFKLSIFAKFGIFFLFLINFHYHSYLCMIFNDFVLDFLLLLLKDSLESIYYFLFLTVAFENDEIFKNLFNFFNLICYYYRENHL